MDWDIMRQGLDLIVHSQTEMPEVSFFGGEPMLAFPLLKRAVHYVEDRRPPWDPANFRITTNGLLIDRPSAAFLARHRVRTSLSFGGSVAGQDFRGPGTFKALDRLLCELRAEQAAFFTDLLAVRVTLDSCNLPYLAASIRHLLRRGVRRISIDPVFTHDPGWGSDSAEELQSQIRSVYHQSIEHYRKTREVPVSFLHPPLRRSIRQGAGIPMCAAGRTDRLVMDVDGSLVGCSTLAASLLPELPLLLRAALDRLHIGRLTEEGVAERVAEYGNAFASTALFQNKERKRSAHARCDDCRFLESCYVCPLSSAFIPGNRDSRLVSGLQCEFTRTTSRFRERFRRRVEFEGRNNQQRREVVHAVAQGG